MSEKCQPYASLTCFTIPLWLALRGPPPQGGFPRHSVGGESSTGGGGGGGGGTSSGGVPRPSWNDLAAMGGPGTAPIVVTITDPPGDQQPPSPRLKDLLPRDPLGEVVKSPEEYKSCVVCHGGAAPYIIMFQLAHSSKAPGFSP